jgi:uncharacterized membrane protein YhaH (DUF805 family)
MLDLIFGFNARLGRLQFFLSTIALAVLMTAICFAIVVSGNVHFTKGSQPSWDMLTWPLVCAVLFFMGATFLLQAMRLRDIGWDPVCVLGGWIAIVVIDGIVTTKVPALSLGSGHHSVVAGLVNFVMLCVLYFWPSSGV